MIGLVNRIGSLGWMIVGGFLAFNEYASHTDKVIYATLCSLYLVIVASTEDICDKLRGLRR